MSSGCTLIYVAALEGDYDLYRWLLTDAGQRWLDQRYATWSHDGSPDRSDEIVESRSSYRRSTAHAAAASGELRILWDLYTRYRSKAHSTYLHY